jgi:hypothetical protein
MVPTVEVGTQEALGGRGGDGGMPSTILPAAAAPPTKEMGKLGVQHGRQGITSAQHQSTHRCRGHTICPRGLSALVAHPPIGVDYSGGPVRVHLVCVTGGKQTELLPALQQHVDIVVEVMVQAGGRANRGISKPPGRTKGRGKVRVRPHSYHGTTCSPCTLPQHSRAPTVTRGGWPHRWPCPHTIRHALPTCSLAGAQGGAAGPGAGARGGSVGAWGAAGGAWGAAGGAGGPRGGAPAPGQTSTDPHPPPQSHPAPTRRAGPAEGRSQRPARRGAPAPIPVPAPAPAPALGPDPPRRSADTVQWPAEDRREGRDHTDGLQLPSGGSPVSMQGVLVATKRAENDSGVTSEKDTVGTRHPGAGAVNPAYRLG